MCIRDRYGLASLRVGWGYGSKKIIDELYKIKPPFNVNKIAQLSAIESLKDLKSGMIIRSSKALRRNLLFDPKSS